MEDLRWKLYHSTTRNGVRTVLEVARVAARGQEHRIWRRTDHSVALPEQMDPTGHVHGPREAPEHAPIAGSERFGTDMDTRYATLAEALAALAPPTI